MEGNNYVDLVKSLGRLEKGGLLGIENEGIIPKTRTKQNSSSSLNRRKKKLSNCFKRKI